MPDLKIKQTNNDLKQHIYSDGEVKQKDIGVKVKDYKFTEEHHTTPSVNVNNPPKTYIYKGRMLEASTPSQTVAPQSALAPRTQNVPASQNSNAPAVRTQNSNTPAIRNQNTAVIKSTSGRTSGSQSYGADFFDATPLHATSGASVVDTKNGKNTKFKGKPKFAKSIKIRNAALSAIRLTKNVSSKTKEKIDEKTSPEKADTPEQYATDKASEYVLNKAKSGAKVTKDVGEAMLKEAGKIIKQRKYVQDIPENIKPEETPSRFIKQRKIDQPKRKTPNNSIKKVTSNRSVKTLGSETKSIKKTARSTADKANRSIKTTANTIKNTSTAAKKTAETAKQTAQAAKRAEQAAVKTAQVSAKAAKAVGKAIIEIGKATIEAVKSAGAALAAAGVPVVAIIIIMCIIGGIGATVFGIFMSNEENPDSEMTMSQAIASISAQHYSTIYSPNVDFEYTDVQVIGGGKQIDWKSVLAVYAVETTTRTDGLATEVVTVDKAKLEILRGIVEDMYLISCRKSVVAEMIQIISETATGGTITGGKTVDKTVVIVNITLRTADQYAFVNKWNDEQKKLLKELSSPSYDDLWEALLYNNDVTIEGGTISNTGWMWPVPLASSYISSPYGWRTVNGRYSLHEGIDIAGAGIHGASIVAAKSGTVMAVVRGKVNNKSKPDYGNYVKLKHEDGSYSFYAHCKDVKVNVGQTVQQGQVIATVGNSGYAFGSHVHFEVRDKNDKKLNPASYVKK